MHEFPEQERAAPSAVTVLIVDDDPNICLMLRAMLEDEGYRVAVATDGPQALRELRRARGRGGRRLRDARS